MGAQGADFVQLVADVQNAAALGGQAAQHHEQLFDRLRREHGGGFVQDEQLGLGEQSAHDFHALHLAHREGMHRALGFDVQAVLLGLAADALAHVVERQGLVQTQPDVFGHGQRVEQAEMLEHHADAQSTRFLGVAHLHGLAVEPDLTLVGLDGAVNDFHQGRFARAVFAQDGVYLSGGHVQGHRLVGHHTGVTLGDAAKLQTGGAHVGFAVKGRGN